MKSIFSRSILGIFLFLTIISNFSLAKAEDSSVKNGLTYLASNQNEDGGLHELDQIGSGEIQSDWSVGAFSSAGYDPATIKKGSNSLLNYSISKTCGYTSVTDIERSIMVLSSAKFELASLDCDLKSRLLDQIDSETGKIGPDIVSTIFGVFALKSLSIEIPAATQSYMLSIQQLDGGWSSGWGTEANLTAQAIQALTLTGYDKNSIAFSNAKHYLKSLQIDNGGIKYSSDPWVTSPDSFSDSYTLQAIYSLGEDPLDTYWLSSNGNSIISHLMSLQKEDGSFRFSLDSWGDSTPVWTTAVVIPSLSKMSYPLITNNLIPFNEDQTKIPTPTSSQTPIFSEVTTPASVVNFKQESNETNSVQEEISNQKALSDSRNTTVNLEQGNSSNDIAQNQNELVSSQPAVLGANDRKSHNDPTYLYLIVGLVFGLLLLFTLKKMRILTIAIFVSLLFFNKASADTKEVGLIVRHSDGRQSSFCVKSEVFPISSEEIFKKAQVEYLFDKGFLVSLDSEKALSAWENSANSRYWSHWLDQGNGLKYSNFGGQSKLINAGQVDGWQIGSSEKQITDEAFESICLASAQKQVPTKTVETSSIQSQEQKGFQDDSATTVARKPQNSNTSLASVEMPKGSSAPTISSTVTSEVLGVKTSRNQTSKILMFFLGFLLPIAVAALFKFAKRAKMKKP